jgi:hypothetical protein
MYQWNIEKNNDWRLNPQIFYLSKGLKIKDSRKYYTSYYKVPFQNASSAWKWFLIFTDETGLVKEAISKHLFM